MKSAVPNKEYVLRACRTIALGVLALGSSVIARDAWVRETLTAGGSSAAYLTIDNPTTQPVTITGITVAGAARAQMHEMSGPATAATMRPVTAVVVPAHGSLRLAPGGTHVMLFDVNPPFTPGQSVTMTVTIQGHPRQTIRALVRPLAATSRE
jgi:copper(I)-binding protein